MPKLTHRLAFLLSAFPGLIAGAWMMWLAWENNNQQEVHSESGIDWIYWMSQGIIIFSLVSGLPLMVCAVHWGWSKYGNKNDSAS